MIRLAVLTIISLCFVGIHSQIDKTFCDQNNLVTVLPQMPFPIPPVNVQYQMSIEINSEKTKSSTEMDQYFDGLLNRAVTIIRENGKQISLYTYDATDELIIVSGDLCAVQKASTSTLSPVQSIMINGSEHIISPLGFLHNQNPDLKEVYIGKSGIKGVPVNQWQVCNYDPKTLATQKITYSVSDPTQWSIAVPYGNLSVTPVEVKVEQKLPNGTLWTDIYSITRFRPGIITRDEFWVTPVGLYCPGRQLGKRPPKIAQTFTFRAKVVAPIPGLDDLVGVVTNIREVYDYPNKLYRIDVDAGRKPTAEVHDYKTGVRYIIDKFNGNCTYTTLDPGSPEAELVGNFITMKNSTHFFDFDTVPYQYVGQRHINHINTDVWIGQKKMGDVETTWEWYFMAPGYIQEDGPLLEVNEPVQLIITFYRVFFNNATQKPDYMKVPIYYYFNEFDESGFDQFYFNILSVCYDKLPKKHYTFELPGDYRDLMQTHKTLLYLGVLLGIVDSIAVYPQRISNLEIDFNQDNIVVLFTLLDKAPLYGAVNMTLAETSISDAAALLNVSIATGNLKVIFAIDNQNAFVLLPYKQSLREIEDRNAGFIYVSKETIKKVGYSGGEVAGVAFGLLVVGLVIGIVGGIFFCIYRPDTIPVDRINNFAPINKITGFINPSFKRGASNA